MVYKNVDQNNELTLSLLNIMSLKCHPAYVNQATTTILKLNFVSVNNHLVQVLHVRASVREFV